MAAKKKTKATSAAPRCKACGKPLTSADSIAKGIGAQCESKGYTLEVLADLKAKHTVETLPKGAVKFAVALEAVRAAGIPPGRLGKAMGGNRGDGDLLSEDFQFMYHKGKRYFSKAVLTKRAMTALSKVKGRRKKAKPAAEKKAGVKAPAVKVPVAAKAKAPAKPKAPVKAKAKTKKKKKAIKKVGPGGIPIIEVVGS